LIENVAENCTIISQISEIKNHHEKLKRAFYKYLQQNSEAKNPNFKLKN